MCLPVIGRSLCAVEHAMIKNDTCDPKALVSEYTAFGLCAAMCVQSS